MAHNPVHTCLRQKRNPYLESPFEAASHEIRLTSKSNGHLVTSRCERASVELLGSMSFLRLMSMGQQPAMWTALSSVRMSALCLKTVSVVAKYDLDVAGVVCPSADTSPTSASADLL